MGYPPNAAARYKNAAIESASKEKLLLMLYEGAIKNMKLAQKALEEKRVADKGNYLGKAHDIVSELSNSLNHEVGGKISEDLESLYFYMLSKITEGNINNDPKCLESVTQILETLLEGWREAVDIAKKEKRKT